MFTVEKIFFISRYTALRRKEKVCSVGGVDLSGVVFEVNKVGRCVFPPLHKSPKCMLFGFSSLGSSLQGPSQPPCPCPLKVTNCARSRSKIQPLLSISTNYLYLKDLMHD